MKQPPEIPRQPKPALEEALRPFLPSVEQNALQTMKAAGFGIVAKVLEMP